MALPHFDEQYACANEMHQNNSNNKNYFHGHFVAGNVLILVVQIKRSITKPVRHCKMCWSDLVSQVNPKRTKDKYLSNTESNKNNEA